MCSRRGIETKLWRVSIGGKIFFRKGTSLQAIYLGDPPSFLLMMVPSGFDRVSFASGWARIIRNANPLRKEGMASDHFSYEELRIPIHSSDLSFILNTFPQVATKHEIPLLAVFVRAGTKYLEQCINSIDYPVHTLVIVQDSLDDPSIAPSVKTLAAQLVGPGRLIANLRHVVNLEHSGCAQAWNTVYRLAPTMPFWIFSANDIFFPPGQLELFYLSLLAHSINPTVGMISSRIDFDPGDTTTRNTFGLMTWAVTRQGLLKGGLFDENFYPGYWEDDDIVWRFWLSSMELLVTDAVMIHGDPLGPGGYYTGTIKEDARGEFAREVTRSRNEQYFKAKWGPESKGIDAATYSWMATPGRLESVLKSCLVDSAHKRFCTPFKGKQAVSEWVFSSQFRTCVRDGKEQGDCLVFLPGI